jgi:prepilin-type N-terminal cleavage/methylation domain-containing protein
MNTKKLNNSGFTLTELLISVTIIALVSSATVLLYTDTVKRARDARRLSDMADIQVALESYRADHGVYPGRTELAPYSDNDCYGWDTSYDGKFLNPLVKEGYLTKNLMDPLNNPDKVNDPLNSPTACAGQNQLNLPGFNYFYYFYPPTGPVATCAVNGCITTSGNMYVLGIGDLEMTDRPSPESPGWSCLNSPYHNWENDFEWVTGSYDGSK